MSSLGPSTPYFDLQHMYNFKDIRTQPGTPIPDQAPPGSVMDFINKNPETQKFKKIIVRSGMQGQFWQVQEDLTVFVPLDRFITDEQLCFATFDPGTARQIVASSTLSRDIDGYLVTSSPFAYYTTKNRDSRMFITTINRQTTINDRASVVATDVFKGNNGRVHFIDSLLIPTDCTYLN